MFQFSDKLCPAGNAFKTAAEQNSFNLSQKRIFYKCSEAGIIHDNVTYKASRIWQGENRKQSEDMRLIWEQAIAKHGKI